MEFKLREADFGQYPKGLIYNINLMNSWLYDGDATMYLHYEEALKTVKQWAKEGKFEALIQEYLLDNTHSHILILEPDENVIAKQEKDLADKLAQKKASMSKEDIEKLLRILKN